MSALPVTNTMAAARAAGRMVAVTKLAADMAAAQTTCPMGIPAFAPDWLLIELMIRGSDTATARGVLCRSLASLMGYVTCSQQAKPLQKLMLRRSTHI